MSESFDKAVEAAWLAMLGRPTQSSRTIRAALRAALPHLTAQDVPHVAREAWAEGREIGYNEALGFQGPTNSHAEEAADDHA